MTRLMIKPLRLRNWGVLKYIKKIGRVMTPGRNMIEMLTKPHSWWSSNLSEFDVVSITEGLKSHPKKFKELMRSDNKSSIEVKNVNNLWINKESNSKHTIFNKILVMTSCSPKLMTKCDLNHFLCCIAKLVFSTRNCTIYLLCFSHLGLNKL